MITQVFDVAVPVALVASGLTAGLFFAFATAVMPGLARVSASRATASMQAVNSAILNPVFGVVYGAATLACVTVAVTAPFAGSPLRLAGALVMLVGAIGVTAVANIPLNKALDRVDPDGADAAAGWARFAGPWNRWNQVRTVAATVATALLALGGSA